MELAQRRFEGGDGYLLSSTASKRDEVKEMEQYLDGWYGDMREHIMSYIQHLLEKKDAEVEIRISKITDSNNAEKCKLTKEIQDLNRTVNEIEDAVAKKDHLISNLKQDIEQEIKRHQKEISAHYSNNEILESKLKDLMKKLSAIHCKKVIMKKHWNVWRSATNQKNLQKSVDDHHRIRCQPVLDDLQGEVERLNGCLQHAHSKVNQLQTRLETIEDGYKSALLRGVCALNLEAMCILQDEQGTASRTQPTAYTRTAETHSASPVAVATRSTQHPPTSLFPTARATSSQQVTVATTTSHTSQACSSVAADTDPVSACPINMATSNGTAPMQQTGYMKEHTDQYKSLMKNNSAIFPKSSSFMAHRKPQSLNTAPVGRSKSLASSVIVERHLPITKETVGQAVASRYIQDAEIDNYHKRKKKQQKNL